MSLPIRQVAYFCADVRAAARAHHAAFGSGPFFVADNIPLARAVHRGVERVLDHSSAYGQWGEVMVEFVQQNNAGPSPFHDLYPEGSGRFGLHHVAVWVDDVDAAIARFDAAGAPCALRAEMNDGFVFAFADTSPTLGHMTELYTPVPVLADFYTMVSDAAKSYRGGDIIIDIAFS
ncbi:VOC family protein [Novosphingobium sp. KCTC 2891]|uniref:VOC family protein n=1 Tax=Novosphingobium sp. KCTC 2891 TaxID=2989730 RepID=UPI002222A5E6|nr:VOC family protein [Novosphingobium sp. KCTC 2891]MCW1382782.1 VOC family protein [Novosphingobium sp. KCTC 2891]